MKIRLRWDHLVFITGILIVEIYWFNIKMPSYQYRNSHCRDKMILQSSFLKHGISYTDMMTSLYWTRGMQGYYLISCFPNMSHPISQSNVTFKKKINEQIKQTKCNLVETSYLDPFDAEAQRGSGAHGFSPLHVAGFGDALLGMLLLRRLTGVDLDHLLVHVLKWTMSEWVIKFNSLFWDSGHWGPCSPYKLSEIDGQFVIDRRYK